MVEDITLLSTDAGQAMRMCAVLLAVISCSSVSMAVAAGPGTDAPTEMKERATIEKATVRAFFADDFAQLETTAKRYRAEQSRTPSGLWKLTLFYAGIVEALDINTVGDPAIPFKALESRVRRWQRQFPESPSAPIALSLLHISHAWAYRGDGYASTVEDSAWKPFYANIELARQNLEAHKAIAAIDPRWYETMLIVARAQGWDRERFERLLEEALQREPLFYQTYFAALEYLLPKWHGDVDAIEAFARKAVERTSQQEGEGMYARIYWYASQGQFELNLFQETDVLWPRMKRGFDAVLAQYPDAWNLNNFAKFACLARDQTTTRMLIDRIRFDVVPQAWRPLSLWEQCWEWAKHPEGGGPLK